ncbi:MAG: hypothetical protein IPN69_18410 [Acidobacteria bacterium]|nr:hypothetical protein [Acidobacteriota bacterium]
MKPATAIGSTVKAYPLPTEFAVSTGDLLTVWPKPWIAKAAKSSGTSKAFNFCIFINLSRLNPISRARCRRRENQKKPSKRPDVALSQLFQTLLEIIFFDRREFYSAIEAESLCRRKAVYRERKEVEPVAESKRVLPGGSSPAKPTKKAPNCLIAADPKTPSSLDRAGTFCETASVYLHT